MHLHDSLWVWEEKKISFYLHCFPCSLCWGFFSSMMIAWHSIFIVYCDIKKKKKLKNQLFSSFRVCLQGQVQTDASLSVCSSKWPDMSQLWSKVIYRHIHMALVFWGNKQGLLSNPSAITWFWTGPGFVWPGQGIARGSWVFLCLSKYSGCKSLPEQIEAQQWQLKTALSMSL